MHCVATTFVGQSTIKLEVRRVYVNMRFCFKSEHFGVKQSFFVLFTMHDAKINLDYYDQDIYLGKVANYTMSITLNGNTYLSLAFNPGVSMPSLTLNACYEGYSKTFT